VTAVAVGLALIMGASGAIGYETARLRYQQQRRKEQC